MLIPKVDLKLQLPVDLAEGIASSAHALDAMQRWHDHNAPRWYRFWQIHEHYVRPFSDEKFVARLLKQPNEDERRQTCQHEVAERCKAVAFAFYGHELASEREDLIERLKGQMQQALQHLDANPLPESEHEGVMATLTALAHSVRWQGRLHSTRDAMERITNCGLPVYRMLEAVNIMYDQALTGLGTFSVYKFNVPNLRFVDIGGADELATACEEAETAKATFEEASRALSECLRPDRHHHMASLMEQALSGRDGNGCQPGWSSEQLKADFENTEALGQGALYQSKLWHYKLGQARNKVQAAIDAVAAGIAPCRNEHMLNTALDSNRQIAVYKAMINCIAARYLLGQIDEVNDRFLKKTATAPSFMCDPRVYINATLGAVTPPAV